MPTLATGEDSTDGDMNGHDPENAINSCENPNLDADKKELVESATHLTPTSNDQMSPNNIDSSTVEIAASIQKSISHEEELSRSCDGSNLNEVSSSSELKENSETGK